MGEKKEILTVIRPKTGWLDIPVKEILGYKDLIMLFVKRDFVSMYKQTVLGPAWAVIQPFVTTVIFSLIFGNVAGLAADGVPTFIFYLSGNILWGYFSGCLTKTSNTFIANASILGKVYFPRLVMPITSVISKLIDFAIQFSFMLLFEIYYVVSGNLVHPNLFVLITPLLILQMAMLGLGCGIIVSAATTKYRDLRMVVSFGVSLWMYASPVAYDMFSMSVFAPGGKYYHLYMLNPITSIINVFRYAFLGIGQIDWTYYWMGWAVTVILLFFGVILFSRVEKTFMDTV
jgi:lipopolysaccharide transport system permease protein